MFVDSKYIFNTLIFNTKYVFKRTTYYKRLNKNYCDRVLFMMNGRMLIWNKYFQPVRDHKFSAVDANCRLMCIFLLPTVLTIVLATFIRTFIWLAWRPQQALKKYLVNPSNPPLLGHCVNRQYLIMGMILIFPNTESTHNKKKHKDHLDSG